MRTEEEWKVCNDPRVMLHFLIGQGQYEKWERKLRLFCVANVRHKRWFETVLKGKEPRLWELLSLIEKWIDGYGPRPKLPHNTALGLYWIISDQFGTKALAWCKSPKDNSGLCMSDNEQADVLRHLIGNPFRS